MAALPLHPRIYEINTAVWLTTLSQKYHKPIQLNTIPDEEIAELAKNHIDAVWLMGVWQRGAATRASALNYIHEYRTALPDVRPVDVIGSAYAIHDYVVDPMWGGRAALVSFRRQLARHSIKLILDFVPNHVAVDHPEIAAHPDYFVLGTPELLSKDTTNFFPARDKKGNDIVVAHGRDPYFPGWIDTAQWNAFSSGFRSWAVTTLRDIADQCDGVRCDMAMLMLNEVFTRTWGWLLQTPPPAEDFWNVVIPKVKAAHPHFTFIAEAYWNMEYVLQTQGFDYTYDKTMYDRIVQGSAGSIRSHLTANIEFLKKNIRFIENHDEPRAAAVIGIDRSRPAATLICTLPGAVLLHDGQFTGRRVKLPVHIARQPHEPEHVPLQEFYRTLLEETEDEIYQYGTWTLFECYPACDTCPGSENLIAYGWQRGGDYRIIVINMADTPSLGIVKLDSWANVLRGHTWQLYDVLYHDYLEEAGVRIANEGLRVDLDAYQSHIYHLRQHTPIKQRLRTIFSPGD